jgi:hypothetical protein
MSELTHFRYVEFYDVPRNIVFRYRDRLLLLQSAFDEEADDYSDSYSVYVLPDNVEASIEKSSWDFLRATRPIIGRIPIEVVRFDSTKRKSLDPSCVDALVARSI